MDEQQLIQKARAGDTGAMQALYRSHAARVYAVVRRLADDDEMANDWAQEAWVRALRSLADFRGDARFGTWIHRIAVNCALHGRRTDARRSSRESPMPVDGLSEPERDTLLQVRLERAISQLPEGMRRVLVLHDVEGYTHEEIGRLLGITDGTCKSQLFKARARMRSLLSGVNARSNGAEVCNT